MYRRPLQLAVAALLTWGGALTMLPACEDPPKAPAGPKRVTLATDFDRSLVESALRGVSGGVPPLEVEVVYAPSPPEGADVFWSSTPQPGVALAKAGKTRAHAPPAPPAIRDPAGTWNGAAGVGWVLLVNKTLATTELAPVSIEDLTFTRFRGFYGILPPEHPMMRDLRAALTEAWGAEPGRILVSLMGRNGGVPCATVADCADAIAAGRHLFTLVDSVTAQHFIDVSAHLEMVVPDQDALGVMLVPSVVVVLTGAKDAEAAGLLVDRLVALPLPGRVVPKPTLKIIHADVTRFELPTPGRPTVRELPPATDEFAAPPSAGLASTGPASPPSNNATPPIAPSKP